jgi:hypothetical protein
MRFEDPAISDNVCSHSLHGAAPPPDERARKFLPPATAASCRDWCCDRLLSRVQELGLSFRTDLGPRESLQRLDAVE